MDHFYIQAYSALTENGLFSSKIGHKSWELDQDKNPLNLKRKQVYDKPYTGFGKLNAPEKLAFGVSALIFSHFSEIENENTGICLANTFGSLSTDILFAESIVDGFPSPSIFSATLPSSPIADIAILFKLKGPNRIQTGTFYPGFSIIDTAIQLLTFNKSDSILTILVNAVESNHKQLSLIPKNMDTNPYSFALLITKKQSYSGLNYKMDFDISNSNIQDISQYSSEKSYFLELITAMMNNNEYRCSFPIYGRVGYIKLIKEQ